MKSVQKKIVKGYVLVYHPEHPYAVKGYVQEHRLIVETFIGKLLLPSEVIHHLDENKGNNDISNLMIFPNQKEHMKFHTKLKQHGYTNPIRRQIANRWEEYIQKDIPKGL